MKPEIQKKPFKVPTGDDKIIEEHFGKASLGGERVSIANMKAPSNWSEPFQKPNFNEYTLMISGKLQIEVDGETFIIGKGESILVYKGSRVRYSNPFNNLQIIIFSTILFLIRSSKHKRIENCSIRFPIYNIQFP